MARTRRKKKLSKGQIIILSLVGIALLVVAIIVIRWLVLYQLYDGYKEDISSYEVEAGTAFTAITESSSNVDDADMVLAAENDYLKLYADVATGEVAVYDKRSGQITYSNPQNADEDTVATGLNINYMKSQLIVDYFDTNRNQGKMDSFSYSSDRGQVSIQAIENGIRFLYTIGNLDSETGIVPMYISKATLESVCSKIDSTHADIVRARYKEDSSVKKGYLKLLDTVVKNLSAIEKLNAYFEEAGFTQADYMAEMEGSGIEGALPAAFAIPLEYRLVEDAVEVSVPMSAVEESGGASIYRIQVLPYFGCAGLDEEGYMLVPNGSGSLINFNNGKTTATTYTEYVYGIDPLAADYTVIENSKDVKMGLFGLFRSNSDKVASGKTGFLATIEDGASFAIVSAGISGKIVEQNYVNATFVLRGNDKLSMFGTTGNEAEIPIVETNFYDANLTIRYTMLNDDDATYVGAANRYRERLLDEGVLTADADTTSTAESDIKFYYDILGGVTMIKHFLGVQYNGMYTMTTFDEAAAISDDLAERGITNQVMNFQGWLKGGYYHDVTDRVRIASGVGSKSDMEALNETVKNNGGLFYADVAFQHVTVISKHYEENNETSRYYGSGYIVELGLVNPTTLRQTSSLGYAENQFYLLSPKYLSRYVDAFAGGVSNIDIDGIALRDLGNELQSDKRRTELIDREAALDIVKASFATIEETGKNTMVTDGNDYTWAYAEDILDVPLTDNDYIIIDEVIPFYQMIVHGSIDYSCNQINLNETVDDDELVLNLIASGASPHFVFTEKESSDIKDTSLNRYYATTYKNWNEYAVEIYNRVNEALKYVNDAYMVDHKIVDANVQAITYSNGITIYVNYGTEDAKVDGITVPARSYAMGGM